ncbi:MAG TPA: HNH endonuclease [Candidatus Dojkabacteria bacterium]|nr:HNH endonuclease [Candidatus Dojkabacteria bacterium]
MNNNYVYLHRRKDTGEVFYVGEGKIDRVKSRTRKNKKWKEIVSVTDFEIEIVAENLSKEDSLRLEKELISKYPNTVNSKHHSNASKELDFDVFNEWFVVDSSSPTGLSWKKDNNSNSPKNRKYKGDFAGIKTYRPNGQPSSVLVSLFSNKFSTHRIVWLLTHGSISKDLVVDHIDGNPFNNKIENLRLVTAKENANNSVYRSSKTGTIGVQKDTMNGVEYYVATWYENRKQRRKAFRISKYGEQMAFELAVNFRNEKSNGTNRISPCQ